MTKLVLVVAALLLVASCAPYRSWGGPGWNCSGGYWGGSGYYNAPANYSPYGGYGR